MFIVYKEQSRIRRKAESQRDEMLDLFKSTSLSGLRVTQQGLRISTKRF